MSNTTRSVVAATFAVLAIVIAAPSALATSTSTAISICTARGSDCTIIATNTGGYLICVNNNGVRQCVSCPPLMGSGGSCSVASSIVRPKLHVYATLPIKSGALLRQ